MDIDTGIEVILFQFIPFKTDNLRSSRFKKDFHDVSSFKNENLLIN